MKIKLIVLLAVAVLAIIAVSFLVKPSDTPLPGEASEDGAATLPPAPVTPPTSGSVTPPPAKKVTPPASPAGVPPKQDQVPPKAPTDFEVTAVSPVKVKLRWQSSDAPVVDGFHVTRSTRADFADAQIIGAIPSFDTAPFFFTVYDPTVTTGTTYWYYVTAYNEAGDSRSTDPISIAVPRAAAPTVPQPVSVSITDSKFSPESITVPKGTEVTWTNLDSASHTVTSDSAAGPTSSLLSVESTYSFTFTIPGTYTYHCTLHSAMAGTVVVTE